MRGVEGIERELARMRLRSDGLYDLRASVLNLLVVADEGLAGEVSEVISRLSGNHPSRSIILITDSGAPESRLDVQISTMCNVPGPEGRHVCSEQITLHIEGEPARHPESFADPLLLPDLPAVMWCPGEISLDAPGFRRLAGMADRLILDSATAGDCGRAMRKMAGFVDEPGMPHLGDLQWTALLPWRSFIAALFDPPERAPALRELRRVRIEHRPGGLCRALLLAGWLASALGLHPESGKRSGDAREYDLSGGVRLELEQLGSDAAPPRVLIESAGASFEVSVGRLRIREGSSVTERAVRLEAPGTGDLLGEELTFFGRDGAYEAALKVAAEL